VPRRGVAIDYNTAIPGGCPLVYKIGLTGNIGCGKSAVGAVLGELGAEYVDADRLVHTLLAGGGPIVERVVGRFGPAVLDGAGGVDRRRLANIVFADPAALRDLETLLHPAVRTELRRRLAATTASVIVLDAIKLIESGLYKELDSVWVVTCDPTEQRRRLIELRGMSPEEADARIAAQPPQEAKLPYANVVVDNSGAPAETRRRVLEAWERTVADKIST
jgi:dephospho-CoA kinase